MPTKETLNDDQKEAFSAIRKFIDHPAADTFVLKGYAGTGKTFLMQHFAKWLKEHDHKFALLASTGRAATVLRGKTGFQATTVHGELYRFSRVDGDEEDIPEDAPPDKYGQMVLQFRLRPPDEGRMVYIIDESSMLSSEIQDDAGQVNFGSGQLLIDFFDAVGTNKVVFVGDPGQLPPVGQAFSPALDMDWLASRQRTAISTTLSRIERNDAGNDILILASMIRSLVPDAAVRFPRLPARNLNNVTIHRSDAELLDAYLGEFRKAGSNGTLAVARSNVTVNEINRAVRIELYGDADLPLQAGDMLMVVQNNYAEPLTNGDFVQVTGLGEMRQQAELNFQRVKVKAMLSETEYELLLSIDVLYSGESNLTQDQSRRLMIDFSKRMKRRGIKPNSSPYREQMIKDPYLNCLKAKYGYAVTCHKAQGGEWDHVFLFLSSKMYGMSQGELFRWWYTAATRARQQLHLSEGWWLR